MTRRQTLASALAATALFTAAANAEVLKTDCSVDDKQAQILLDAQGKAEVTVSQGQDNYHCGLRLTGLEGPPFSDNATGMLVLELARGNCEPAAGKRKVQRSVDLHIADPSQASNEAMAVIERRSGVFKCAIRELDMPALRKLAAPLLGGAAR